MLTSKKPALVYLVHRIPYPPNKGDKIRSFHILQFLSQYYRIYLGTFIDDPFDNQYKSIVAEYCEDVCFIQLNPTLAKLKSLKGLITREPLSIPYYSSKKLKKWLSLTLKKQSIDVVLGFSSPMAQFFNGLPSSISTVMDMVDIDSDKWKQYAKNQHGIYHWIYSRESKLLAKYEEKTTSLCDATLLVSEAEALIYQQQIANSLSHKIHAVTNGIDFEYFTTESNFATPYPASTKVLVFTGAMDYWANCDAVIWFYHEVFCKLYKQDNHLSFYIVGSNPSKEVLALGAFPGVTVTGKVDDIRPYIKYAWLSIAPLRIARGIQNKVLEAMALGKVVIATQNAFDGIKLSQEQRNWVANTAQEQYQLIIKMSQFTDLDRLGKDARIWIKEHYSWHKSLDKLISILQLK